MYKRIFTYLLVLLVLVVGYTKVIDIYKQMYDNYDRTLVVYDYDGKDYVGKYNYQEHLVTLMELDPKLQITEDKVIDDVKSAKELQKVIKDDFLYETQDYFEFDGKKLVNDNLKNNTKKLYKESYDHYKAVQNILAGNKKEYSPEYNNELLRVQKSMNSEDDGVMNKSIVKEMIKADIPKAKIVNAFITSQKLETSCKEKVCTIEEQSYNIFAASYNQDTKHKLPEYDKITENMTDLNKEFNKEKAEKEKAEKEKAKKEKAKKEKAEKEATTAEATTAEATTAEATTAEATTAEATSWTSSTTDDATEATTKESSSWTSPTTDEATTDDVTEVTTKESSSWTSSTTDDATTDDVTTDDAATDDTTTDDTTTDDTTTDDTTTDDAATDDSATDDTTTDDTTTDDTTTDDTTTDDATEVTTAKW